MSAGEVGRSSRNGGVESTPVRATLQAEESLSAVEERMERNPRPVKEERPDQDHTEGEHEVEYDSAAVARAEVAKEAHDRVPARERARRSDIYLTPIRGSYTSSDAGYPSVRPSTGQNLNPDDRSVSPG